MWPFKMFFKMPAPEALMHPNNIGDAEFSSVLFRPEDASLMISKMNVNFD